MNNKRPVDEAKEILKDIVRQAHADSMHSGALSRLKSIVGLQPTSIEKFLESILEGFAKYASRDDYKKAEVIIKLDLKNGDSDIWSDYQNGGGYPKEFDKLGDHIMESLTGIKL